MTDISDIKLGGPYAERNGFQIYCDYFSFPYRNEVTMTQTSPSYIQQWSKKRFLSNSHLNHGNIITCFLLTENSRNVINYKHWCFKLEKLRMMFNDISILKMRMASWIYQMHKWFRLKWNNMCEILLLTNKVSQRYYAYTIHLMAVVHTYWLFSDKQINMVFSA